VPGPLDVHLIADNYATHKHPKVKAWLAKDTRRNECFMSGVVVRWCSSTLGGTRRPGC
jgi:hypothetical protein